MAVSISALGAAHIASITGDKPIVLADNGLRIRNISVEWRQGGSWAAGSDETDSDFPVERMWDGYPDVVTKPDALQATWYLLMDFGATTAITCDAIAMLAVTANASATVDFQVADNNAYTTNLTTLASWTASGSEENLASFSFASGTSTHEQASGVQYARLKFTTGTTHIPQIGELYLGEARPLYHASNRPWNADAHRTRYVQSQSAAGIIGQQRRENSTAAPATFQGQWSPHRDEQVENFQEWLRGDTEGGAWPFVWNDNPSTDENDIKLMWLDDPGIRLDRVGFSERTALLAATEQL